MDLVEDLSCSRHAAASGLGLTATNSSSSSSVTTNFGSKFSPAFALPTPGADFTAGGMFFTHLRAVPGRCKAVGWPILTLDPEIRASQSASGAAVPRAACDWSVRMMLEPEICASQSAPGAAPTLAFDWSASEFAVRKSAKDRGGFATGLAGARSPRLKERCVVSLSDKADVTAVFAAAASVGTSFWLL